MSGDLKFLLPIPGSTTNEEADPIGLVPDFSQVKKIKRTIKAKRVEFCGATICFGHEVEYEKEVDE